MLMMKLPRGGGIGTFGDAVLLLLWEQRQRDVFAQRLSRGYVYFFFHCDLKTANQGWLFYADTHAFKENIDWSRYQCMLASQGTRFKMITSMVKQHEHSFVPCFTGNGAVAQMTYLANCQ